MRRYLRPLWRSLVHGYPLRYFKLLGGKHLPLQQPYKGGTRFPQ